MYVLRAIVCINTYKYVDAYYVGQLPVGQLAVVRIAVGVRVGVGAAVNNNMVRCMYVLRAAVCIDTYKYVDAYNVGQLPVGQLAVVRIAVVVGVGVGAAVNNRSTHFRRLSHCIICSHYNPLGVMIF